MESDQRSGWNHHKVMYGINPKERYTLARDAIRLRRLHTRSREITYQSFGLDRKKQVLRLAFFLSSPNKIAVIFFIINTGTPCFYMLARVRSMALDASKLLNF